MISSIFSYKASEVLDSVSIQYYNCTFKKDFGPWKQGDECGCMYVDYVLFTMKQYTNDGDVIAQCEFMLDPKEV